MPACLAGCAYNLRRVSHYSNAAKLFAPPPRLSAHVRVSLGLRAEMNKDFTPTPLALLIGVIWGLILGCFCTYTGPWLVVLLGPPAILLLSAKRPLLSWQVPLVSAAITATILNRDRGNTGSGGPGDTPGSVLLDAFLIWLMFSLFSCPWAFIFQRRAKRAQQSALQKAASPTSAQPATPPPDADVTPARIGAVLLVFLACAVVLAGSAVAIWPAASTPGDRADHLIGLLIAAAGVAFTVGIYRLAHRLSIGDSVKQVLELPLILAAVFGGLFFVGDLIPVSKYAPPQLSTPSPLDQDIWGLLAALIASAGLVVLARLKRRLAKVNAATP